MKTNTKAGKTKAMLPILLAISLLLAAGEWIVAINLYMTSTPRLNPGALETLRNNPVMATSDSGLLQAFERRNSTKRGAFTGNEISEDVLQLLGWAATGKNRDGTGFVIPLAMGADPYVSLYLAQESGVRRFSWKSNHFEAVVEGDIRNKINSGQNASAIWIYVVDIDGVPNGNMDWAWHAIGAMSEHQYLVADEFDIQARFMASISTDEVAALLGLDSGKYSPVGVMIMAQK
ncbi:MAG: hypothetical protein FWG10_14140 [Eubacteriaceae bacterium]|nr:hypothetical protein [Eubacteriaceae bacterium]